MNAEIVAPPASQASRCPIIDASCALLIQTAITEPGSERNPNAKALRDHQGHVACRRESSTRLDQQRTDQRTHRGFTMTPLDAVYGVDEVNINRSHLISPVVNKSVRWTVPPP
jgi:hypothetical protein